MEKNRLRHCSRIVRERQMDTWDEFLRWATPSALLTPEGTIHSLNAPMAATLGRQAKQCVGYDFVGLLP
jgi:hypothetical protein